MSAEPALITLVSGAGLAGSLTAAALGFRPGRATASLETLAAQPDTARPARARRHRRERMPRWRRWTCPVCGRAHRQDGPPAQCLCPYCGEFTGRCTAGHRVCRTDLVVPDPCSAPATAMWLFIWADRRTIRAGLCREHVKQIRYDHDCWEHGLLAVAKPLPGRHA